MNLSMLISNKDYKQIHQNMEYEMLQRFVSCSSKTEVMQMEIDFRSYINWKRPVHTNLNILSLYFGIRSHGHLLQFSCYKIQRTMSLKNNYALKNLLCPQKTFWNG